MKWIVCFIVVIALALFACDAIISADGIILDKETRMPVANTSIELYNKNDTIEKDEKKIYSDASGRFRFSKIVLMSRDFKLTFSKSGYITQLVSFTPRSSADTIYLAKHMDLPF